MASALGPSIASTSIAQKLEEARKKIAKLEDMVARFEAQLSTPDAATRLALLQLLCGLQQELGALRQQVTAYELEQLRLASSAGDDNSKQWAIDMVSLAPDEPLPQDAAAVRNFLSRALPKSLPVFRGCFDNLTRDPIAGALAKASLTVDAGLHKLQMFFEQALTAEVRDATVVTSLSFLRGFTDELLLTLSELTGQLELEVARDKSALSRPDCCAWHKGVLLFKGEDGVPNGGHTLYQAEEELGTKMSGRWNELTMGSLPFIVCYANCGAQLQYHIMMRDSKTAVAVSEVFNLRQDTSRILALRAGVNVFRLLKLLAGHVGDGRLPVGKEAFRACGVRITYKVDSVVKNIDRYKEQPNVNPKLKVLREVYKSTRNAAHLVHAVRAPRVCSSRYSVELQPLGYHCHPASLAELRDAMRAVLCALTALHDCGFVHRDVRWGNMLRDSQGSWFLSDLEFAAKAGTVPPSDFRHISWTSFTLVGGKYTTASDMEQAGRMMLNCLDIELSPAGGSLRDSLTAEDASRRPTASEALQHHWFLEGQP